MNANLKDYTAQAEDLLRQHLLHLPANPMQRQPSVDTALDLMYDDLPAALAEDQAEFRKALAANDHCEIGRLLRVAAERCADRYIASENGRLEVGLIEDTLREEA